MHSDDILLLFCCSAKPRNRYFWTDTTYLGGIASEAHEDEKDVAYCIVVTDSGDIWISGYTSHSDFPITENSMVKAINGEGDIFLARFDADLTQLLYSTYIGGGQKEAPTDLLLNTAGEVYMTGWTFSADFPMTSDGYDTSHGLHQWRRYPCGRPDTGHKLSPGPPR